MQFWTKVGSSEKTWGFLLVRNVFGMQKKAEVAWKATLHNETREPRLSLAQYSKSRAVETSVIMPAPVVNSSQNPTLYLHLCPLFAFYPLHCNSPFLPPPLLEKHPIKSVAKAQEVKKRFKTYRRKCFGKNGPKFSSVSHEITNQLLFILSGKVKVLG